jgi:hypothetical protein
MTAAVRRLVWLAVFAGVMLANRGESAPPVLKFRFGFDDAGPGTTTASDTSTGGAAATLQMLNNSGVATDYHGGPNSGVAGNLNGNRALDFSSVAIPGGAGPVATTTNATLGFGQLDAFTLTLWLKQAAGWSGTNGPRLFILADGTASDAGQTNSLGLTFLSASQLNFYMNTGNPTASATFAANLPTNTWVFVAVTYDGTNVTVYEGTDTAPTMLISQTAAASQMVNLGANGALYVGNRRARDRAFDGWIDDLRFYTGAADVAFIENLRTTTTAPAINVYQYHNHDSRDGLFIDPAFTLNVATNLKRDLTFDGTVSGNIYAQPLYIEGGPSGKAMIIAVTESNIVYALDAANGTVLWHTFVGTNVPMSALGCGDIDPLGITGTPIVDLPSRNLFFDAMTTTNGGVLAQHRIFSLNVDTGMTNAGWPVELNSITNANGIAFTSKIQNQRGALAIVGTNLYVPYGGHYGNCGLYHGWLVNVPLCNPSGATAWATAATWGGVWAVGGVASDGVDPFIATGNTYTGGSGWGGGEAIIRLQSGPLSTNCILDYWTPANWLALDNVGADIGSSGPLLVDVPGATPPNLVVALGEDGNAYLLNRTNLGGINPYTVTQHVAFSPIIQAAASYRTTSNGTFVVYRGNPIVCSNSVLHSADLGAFWISPSNPPAISTAWCGYENGRGSPFVTSTDGTHNVIVWAVGAEGDQRLHGFDGNTGTVLYNGGGSNELMTATRRFSTGIVARGRIFVAADNKVYAFTLPVSPINLTDLTLRPDGSFQAGFTNTPGMTFTVLCTTNLATPPGNWTSLGGVTEASPGHFQFTDLHAPPNHQRFYRVRRL